MTLARLTHRHLVPERMDAPDLAPSEHRRALRALARLNRVGGATRILWPPVREVAMRLGRPIRVLDVACGGGDITVHVAKRARRAGIRVSVDGCDISPTALAEARAHATAAGVDAGFFECNVLGDALPHGYDLIVTSQFLHHLDDDSAARLLAEMAAKTQDTICVSDLVRSRRNLWITAAASHALTRSKVVHFDGPQSIRAAFKLDEARAVATRAGLAGCRVAPRRPVHFLLTWTRPNANGA